MYCPRCGSSLEDTAKFCTNCGTKIEKSEDFMSNDADDTSVVSSSPKEVRHDEDLNHQDNKKSFGKNTYGYFVVAIAIILAVVGGILVRNRRNASEDDTHAVSEADSYTEYKNDDSDSMHVETDSVEMEDEIEDSDLNSVEDILETEAAEIGDAKETEAAEIGGTQETDLFNSEVEPIISYVEATSCLSELGMTHTADRINDGTLEKAWVEGAYGQGIGENVTLYFDDDYIIKSMVINAGYQKSEKLYYKNSRPCAMKVYYSDGYSENIELSDINGTQEIELNYRRKTSFIKLEIESVYAGSVFEDTVISEVSFR